VSFCVKRSKIREGGIYEIVIGREKEWRRIMGDLEG